MLPRLPDVRQGTDMTQNTFVDIPYTGLPSPQLISVIRKCHVFNLSFHFKAIIRLYLLFVIKGNPAFIIAIDEIIYSLHLVLEK